MLIKSVYDLIGACGIFGAISPLWVDWRTSHRSVSPTLLREIFFL
jgi:hypothetical protein